MTRFEKGLAIAQTEGSVRKIPKVLGSQLYKVRSQTKKDTWYDVVVFSDGNMFCNCPDSLLHSGGEVCKHCWAAMCQDVIIE